MNREQFKSKYRQARIGNLGTLACTTSNRLYHWLLTEVYDVRFPHVGSERHGLNGFRYEWPGGQLHKRLTAFHQTRGWYHCAHKSLLRLWTEYQAHQKAA